jgi:hypothetical protein
MLHTASEWNRFFAKLQSTENGNEIWSLTSLYRSVPLENAASKIFTKGPIYTLQFISSFTVWQWTLLCLPGQNIRC